MEYAATIYATLNPETKLRSQVRVCSLMIIWTFSYTFTEKRALGISSIDITFGFIQ